LDKTPHQQIERGIEALKRRLGSDGATLLLEVPSRSQEIASFDFPLPRDYLGKERVLQIGFTTLFPKYGLQLKVVPRAWLQWPHVMEDGICLFGDRRPYTATPERVVETEIDRLRQLVQEILPSSDPASRKSHFDHEITYYWRRQLRLAPGQYVLVSTPDRSAELFALSDSRESRSIQTTWLSADQASLGAMERRLGLRAAKVRGPAKAGFFLPLTSLPDLRVPDARQLATWLNSHAEIEALTDLKSWLSNTSSFPFRVVVLRVPNAPDVGAFMPLVMRGRHIDLKAAPHYGRRAGRRQPYRDRSKKRFFKCWIRGQSIRETNAQGGDWLTSPSRWLESVRWAVP
jgi:sulfur-carrier protein adenylyltransferase/sulfurtransferase